jgi:hypothetical protein
MARQLRFCVTAFALLILGALSGNAADTSSPLEPNWVPERWRLWRSETPAEKPAPTSQRVKIIEDTGKLRIEVNGELFTEYVYEGAPHVYYYPVIGPGGTRMTRDYPMVKDSVGEEHDHPHHRSIWYSHGDVNGVDFLSESAKAGKIVHDKFLEVKSGSDRGLIRSTCKWVAPDGSVTCTDERTFRVYARPNNERLFDFDITIKAREKELVLGDTKEGSMAVRVAETMRLTHGKNKPGEGHIVQNTGVKDQETWGKHADWCDYYGPVGGKTVGIAIFDHPSNPRHPTTWHVRDYGLFAVNPFGLHDFEKKEKGAGNLTIPAGKSVTFRYRFYIHSGTTEEAKVAERYEEYSKSK